MKSAVTISAVEQAQGGPFVFWGTFPNACELAHRIGFDAVEVFAPNAEYFRQPVIKSALESNNLKLAAVGTGAGWVVSKLTLSGTDENERTKGIAFVKSIIESVAAWQPAVIIGSMQGRANSADEIADTRKRLAESLNGLAEYGSQFNVPLLIEPLNRYETNLLNTVEDGLKLLQACGHNNLKLLCDVFHMNIEEASIAKSLLAAGDKLGHVHFADSNRWAVGFGHLDYTPIIAALNEMKYSGYLSAEVFAKPDAEAAAKQTHLAFQSLCGSGLRDPLSV